MITKLRIKLIVAAMASLLTVLTVIMGGVAWVNYHNIVSQADATLSLLAANDGVFPLTQWEEMLSDREDSPIPQQIPPQREEFFSPELPFETRYFFVRLDSDGHVTAVNTGKIAAVDTSTAITLARQICQEENGRGFVDNYRYLLTSSGEDTLVLFLDRGRMLDSFRTLLISSIFISGVGVALVFLLLLLLSRRIVKPFLENYQKQKQFITDAGHELKTPLTIIDADTEILSMDLGENEWVADIQAQTKRLTQLTQDLIRLSRLEEAPAPRQALEFPLSEVVEETLAGFQGVAKAQDKTLTAHIQPTISLLGEESAIRKLVSILADNALKYSTPGSEILCTLAQKRGQICLTFHNPTPHITREQTARLFDRFYRTDQSRSVQTGGYGLGLSIAQAIVTAHRGRISAATRDERSLTITVTLPSV